MGDRLPRRLLRPDPGDQPATRSFDRPGTVASLAQIPAGWGPYKNLPSNPNFVGTAMLLQEGIENWLGSPSGWNEAEMATVEANGDGGYPVTDLSLTINNTVTAGAIPLERAAIW